MMRRFLLGLTLAAGLPLAARALPPVPPAPPVTLTPDRPAAPAASTAAKPDARLERCLLYTSPSPRD